MRIFNQYAEGITRKAARVLRGPRPELETDAEAAIDLFYCKGTEECRDMTLKQIDHAIKCCYHLLCTELNTAPWFQSLRISPHQYLEHFYKDDRELTALWSIAPSLAESISFWHGMNDVHEFAICFATRAVYSDDFRRIRRAVEKSLRDNGLLDIWLYSKTSISFDDFTLPGRSAERLMNKSARMDSTL